MTESSTTMGYRFAMKLSVHRYSNKESLPKKGANMIDTEVLRKFKELREQKTALNSELREVNEQLDQYTNAITEMFATDGIDSIKVDGKTIYKRNQIWAKIEDGKKEQAMEILEKLGFDDMISLSWQRLSAFVREHIENDAPLPPEFEGVIGHTDKISLGLR